MKNLLEIVKEVLNVAPEALMIKEFKVIWLRDKSKSKDRALKELAYIYHTTDYQSIYRNYHPDMREGKIRLDIIGDKKWEPDKEIIAAQAKYKELQTTLSMELLNDVESGIDKLRTYFTNVSFEEDDEGKAAKNFIANAKAVGDLVKGVKVLREEVEKELVDKMQVRGGSAVNPRELPPGRR